MHRKFFSRTPAGMAPQPRCSAGDPALSRRGPRFFKSLSVPAISAAAILVLGALKTSPITVNAQASDTPGSLQVLDPNGKPRGSCPLKHTDVKAEISGFLSRVVLTQEFENPFKEKIEAVYTFPLPQSAAVDDMTMIVGDRTVRGKILRRQVRITISYVETLKYADGSYEFVFPMVVGPRYVPGTATGAQANGFAADTERVPDASRITPRPAAEGMRAGHDISLDVTLDAGVTIDALNAKTHQVDVERPDDRRAHVRLKDEATIPNKDFILRYDVAGRKIEDALLTHASDKSGFFTFILQPPERVTAEDVMPKELVFVLDTSGSMSGFPIEKAKETMKLAMDNLYPSDTFNLITFSGDEHILFPAPVPATKENLEKAQKFLESREGSGGTEMMKAIKASMDPSDAQGHVRIVCFMTDGYVGNDMEIIAEVRKHTNARVFAFGIGSSVNRFLLDNMARYGRGEVEYVGLNDDGSAAARRFHERVRNPLLTDISIDWNGLPVADVYPQQIPDLFGAKPVVLTGRFTRSGAGVLRLKGKMSGRDFVREIPVEFPEVQAQHDVLATLWARTRVEDLMGQDYNGLQQGKMRDDLKQTITQLGLEYRLMTQFTSFVAVEEMIVTDGGKPRRIDVPVEVPEGVNRERVFGMEVNMNTRNTTGLFYLSAGRNQSSMSQTVTVSRSRAAIDTSRTDVSTVIDQSVIDPGSVAAASRPASKPAKAKRRGGSGAGGGVGGGGGGDARTTPEEEKRQQLLTKLHPAIVAVIDRLKNREAKPGPDEARFIRDGKAEIQIWLNEKSDSTLAELKKLGFEVVLDPKTAKLVIGRLPIEKLGALTELKFVRYVAPQLSGN